MRVRSAYSLGNSTRVEQVPDNDASLEGRGNPLIAPTIFRPGFDFVDVHEQQPELVAVGTGVA